MKQNEIILCYRTDEWNSYASRELIYVGERLEDCIAELQSMDDRPMTEEQAEDVKRYRSSQCTDAGYEWIFDILQVNAFV